MEHNNNMFGEYGDNNILEELVSGNGPSDYNPNELNQQYDGGFDILQQSLKAADILGNEDATNSPFDELGLTFSGDSLSALPPTNQVTLEVPRADSVPLDNSFDTSQFLNITRGSTHQAHSQQNNNNATYSKHDSTNVFHAPEANNQFSNPFSSSPGLAQPLPRTLSPNPQVVAIQRTASPNPVIASIQRTSTQQVAAIQRTASPNPVIASIQRTSNPQVAAIQRTASPNLPPAPSATQNQYSLLKVQISPNSNVVQPSRSYVIQAPTQNTQYVIAGNQPGLYNAGANTSTPVQLVKGSVQPTLMSTPVMLSVAKPQVDIQTGHPAVQQTTAVLSQNQNLANTNTTSSQSIHNPNSFILGSNITVSNQEEQTNKLALLLQNKASQQSGSGKPAVLKVGNQSINISNPKVAKALAANILQQHMRQQTNNNVQQTQQQVVNVTKSQNHAFINLSNMPTQPQVSSGVQPQMKAQYVISTMAQTVQQLPPTSIQTQSNSKVISPEVSTASNPTQYVQLAVSKNNNQVPINRIQIASVNIPISVSTTKASDSSNLGYSSNTSHSVPSIFSSNPITISSTSAHNHYTTVTQNMNPMESVEPQAKPINKDQLTKAWNQQNSQQKINSLTVTTNSTQPASTTMPITLSTQSKLSDSFQKPTMAYVTFQVEPNLTLQQVEQVQNIISQKTSLSKIPALSKEQKQLLAAFRAQLRTMEAPVQQYYLRNPQLFLQKVYQHLQTGKPFVMHMKVDKSKLTTLQTVSSSPTVVSQLVKEEHPTISLTSNYPRASSPSSRVKRSATPNSQLKAPKRLATDTTTAMSPVTRPSLILEQLQKHRELVGNPDIVTPFKTMRDAVRRLLPYHTCNTAEVKHKDFVESEPLFEVISDKLTSKVNAMFSKYHHLACRETTRNECSADVVMLQRSFLQSERAAVVEIKQRITKNPSAIREFISKGQKDSAVTTYFSAEEAKKIDRMESTQDTNQSKVNTNDHSPVEVEKDVLLQEAVLSIL